MNSRSRYGLVASYQQPQNAYREPAVAVDPVTAKPEFCAIVVVDAAGSASRTGRQRFRLRRDLYDLMNDVLNRHGFGLSSFPLSDTGDGFRLFIPLTRIQPADVVDMFVLGFLAGLRCHRRYASETARIRLRMAIDLGLVEPHLQGWEGDPLIRVARLIDAAPLREELLQDPGLDLAVLVSDAMYDAFVRPGDGYIAPECFRPVSVHVKEFEDRAWLLRPQREWYCGSCSRAAA